MEKQVLFLCPAYYKRGFTFSNYPYINIFYFFNTIDNIFNYYSINFVFIYPLGG